MNKQQKARILTALTLSSCVLYPCLAQAAEKASEDLKEYSLDEIVVTATRTEKSVLEAPANVQIISGEQIQEKGYLSAFEAVRNLTQADSLSYQDDGGDYGTMFSAIRLRGLDTGTLVLVNGNPCNFANVATLANIPSEEIERIEVVKGSNSVLYGPQAMGGVINIITKKPSGKAEGVHGNVSVSAGNQKREWGTDIHTGYVNFGVHRNLNKDHNRIEGPGSTGNGIAELNISDKQGTRYYLDAYLGKDLSFNYSRSERSYSYQNGKYRRYVFQPEGKVHCESAYDNFGLVYDSRDTGWRGALGYHRLDARSWYPPKDHRDLILKGYDVDLDVQKRLSLWEGRDSLVLGFTYTRENMVRDQQSLDYQESTRNSFAFYQSYDHKFNDRFNMIFGVREYWVGKCKGFESDFQILPQIQALYKVNKNSSYYVNIGKSFEMPKVNQLFKAKLTFEYEADPNLKPQSSWSYEFGYKFEDEKRTFNADVFYMNVKDKWGSIPTERRVGGHTYRGSYYTNLAEWRSVGLEVNAQQRLDKNWTGSIGFTWQNPESKERSGAWKQDSAKCIFNLGLTFQDAKFTADTRLFANIGREWAYYNYPRTSSKKPDHHLADSFDLGLTLTYRPTAEDTVRLSLRNLLDREDALNNMEYRVLPQSFMFTYDRSF